MIGSALVKRPRAGSYSRAPRWMRLVGSWSPPTKVLVPVQVGFVPSRVAVWVLVAFGDCLGGGVGDGDGAGAVWVAGEELQAGGGALGDGLPVEAVVALGGFGPGACGQADLGVADVEGGAGGVVGYESAAVGVVDVGAGAAVVGDGAEMVFGVPAEGLLAVGAGAAGGVAGGVVGVGGGAGLRAADGGGCCADAVCVSGLGVGGGDGGVPAGGVAGFGDPVAGGGNDAAAVEGPRLPVRCGPAEVGRSRGGGAVAVGGGPGAGEALQVVVGVALGVDCCTHWTFWCHN